jgi:hypothetical protein
MKASVWYNKTRKTWEAAFVGRGRPIPKDASEKAREKSKRMIVTGAKKDEALAALAKASKVALTEIEVVKGIVYEGEREHPYTKPEAKEKAPVEAKAPKAKSEAKPKPKAKAKVAEPVAA